MSLPQNMIDFITNFDPTKNQVIAIQTMGVISQVTGWSALPNGYPPRPPNWESTTFVPKLKDGPKKRGHPRTTPVDATKMKTKKGKTQETRGIPIKKPSPAPWRSPSPIRDVSGHTDAAPTAAPGTWQLPPIEEVFFKKM